MSTHVPFARSRREFLDVAGAKGGTAVGTTDEFGLKGVDHVTSVNDFHATISHLLGLDHELLTFRHSGRDERLTDVGGLVIDAALE